MNAIWISILSTTAATVLSDLTGYTRSRQQWRDATAAGQTCTPPDFDWPLFTTRVAIGVISGALAGLGINAAAA